MSISHPFSSIVAHVQIHDVAKARPEVQKTVDTMLKKGKWSVPGYRVSRTSQLEGKSLTGVGEIRRPPIDVEWLAWSPMENESDYGNIEDMTFFVSRKNDNDVVMLSSWASSRQREFQHACGSPEITKAS